MNTKEADIIPYHASSIPDARVVLVFSPHPDDEVFGCGGALALHARAGHGVNVILLTAGDSKPGVGFDSAYASARLAESSAAASALGITTPECWGLLDRSLGYGEVLVKRMMAAIEAAGADIVYAPSLWESHPDHRAASMSAIEAMRRLGGDRQLFLYELSAPLRPNRLLDISMVWADKAKAMACFVSQNVHLDYPEFIGSLNRYRALTLQRDVTRAEAFEAYPADSLNLPALSPFESERRRFLARGLPSIPQDLPLVSVIIRTMSRATLSQALDSLVTQTYSNIEIILVDVLGQGLNHIDLNYIAFPVRIGSAAMPLGRAQAANLGLKEATGEFCIFLDDDDWFYPDHVAKLVNCVMQNRSIKAAHTAVACVDGAGNATGTIFDFPYAQNELKFGNFMPIHSVLFSSQLVRLGCKFDQNFDLYEDWDFWLQVEAHTPFAFVPGVSAAYRIDAVSGAGVKTDPERARQATAMLYTKWSVYQTEPVFQELITRALLRRHLERQLAGLQRAFVERDAEVLRLGAVATYQQEQAALAAQAADTARSDAHHFREAHDKACNARDMARAVSEFSQQEAHRTRDEMRLTASELGQVRQEHQQTKAAFEHERAAAQRALEQAQTEVIQSQALTALLRHELEAKKTQADELMSSTSWRLTRPVRAAGRLVRKVGTVAAATRVARGRQMSLTYIARRSIEVFRREGLSGISLRVSRLLHKADGADTSSEILLAALPQVGSYADWLSKFDSFDASQRDVLTQSLSCMTHQPLISIIMPVHNPSQDDLSRAIGSVLAQIYPNWELCICDDASSEPHVKKILDAFASKDKRIHVNYQTQNGHISKASNHAIKMACGSYIAFLDHDDELSPHALLRVAQAMARQPEAKVLYSDEDKIDLSGRRFDPYFKPDFNLGLLRSHNYMCHFAVYDTHLLRQLGGLREGYEGAQDYDLALRAVDSVPAASVVHIPHILYHWRTAIGSTAAGHSQKSYAFTAGQRALTAHLARRMLSGAVEEAPEARGMYRIRWATPVTAPLVSIVIPTRNGEVILRQCLDSLKKTSYPNFEVIVIDNGSDDPATLALLAERASDGQLRTIRDERPFNFSALNNRAVNDVAAGDFVLLLNNDIEVINPEWLDEMVGPAMEAGVGCVGARLWYPDGRLQHAGVILVCGVAGHAHKYLPRGQHGYMGRAVLAQDMVGVTAACLLVRKSIYQAVGGLDEGLAVAFNDIDFCLRVHAAGYRNHWTPYAELIHHESVTRGYEDTPEKQRRFRSEIEKMQARWPALLTHDDPCYSPNLTATAEDFSLAWPPRREMP